MTKTNFNSYLTTSNQHYREQSIVQLTRSIAYNKQHHVLGSRLNRLQACSRALLRPIPSCAHHDDLFSTKRGEDTGHFYYFTRPIESNQNTEARGQHQAARAFTSRIGAPYDCFPIFHPHFATPSTPAPSREASFRLSGGRAYPTKARPCSQADHANPQVTKGHRSGACSLITERGKSCSSTPRHKPSLRPPRASARRALPDCLAKRHDATPSCSLKNTTAYPPRCSQRVYRPATWTDFA